MLLQANARSGFDVAGGELEVASPNAGHLNNIVIIDMMDVRIECLDITVLIYFRSEMLLDEDDDG